MSEVLLHAPHVPRTEARTFYKERKREERGRETGRHTDRERERASGSERERARGNTPYQMNTP